MMIKEHPLRKFPDIRVYSFRAADFIERSAEFLSYLDLQEQERMDRFRFDRDKNRYLVSHGMLRLFLSESLQLEPRDITYTYNRQGKPYLSETPSDSSLFFNMSHSCEHIMMALSEDREIGIDIERIRPIEDIPGMAEFFCNSDEMAELRSCLNQGAQRNLFFEIWTRKEAVLKSMGQGLGQLSEIDAYNEKADIERLTVQNYSSCIAVRH